MKKILFILLSITIIANIHMYGQENQFSDLASISIKHFKCAINAKNFKYYSLSSEDVLDDVKVGKAIIHYAVGLDMLKKYDTLTDPNSLIRNMGYVTVPLTNSKSNELEAFVLLNKREDKYQASGIGDAPYSEAFMSLVTRIEKGDNIKLIRVPALNIAYIGVELENTLSLIKIADKDQKELISQPAYIVFEELAKRISKIDRDVPR